MELRANRMPLATVYTVRSRRTRADLRRPVSDARCVRALEAVEQDALDRNAPHPPTPPPSRPHPRTLRGRSLRVHHPLVDINLPRNAHYLPGFDCGGVIVMQSSDANQRSPF